MHSNPSNNLRRPARTSAPSQFRKEGVGVLEPLAIKTTLGLVHDPNRRVEFSIIKVPLKDVHADGFDL